MFRSLAAYAVMVVVVLTFAYSQVMPAGQAHADTITTVYTPYKFDQGTSVYLKTGETEHLTISGVDSGLLWESDDKTIADVSQDGTVTARRSGVTVIYARTPDNSHSAVCRVKTYEPVTRKQVSRSLKQLKKTYYPGMRWTNEDNDYYWGAANCYCYGCAAFAGIASDTAFGKYAPIKKHSTFKKIKIGDVVRIGNQHSVVVTKKFKRSIRVAEGNYKKAIKWGRKITRSELKRYGFYVETRY